MIDNKPPSNDSINVNDKLQDGDIDARHKKQLLEMEEKFKQERDSFQKEMFHRFKNNLQVITSLLNIQSSYVKDEDSRRMFVDSTERVNTMAMIYDKQNQTENPIVICFDNYLRNLVDYIVQNNNSNTKDIRHEINAVNLNLPVKIAQACGLIINELITNSLRHAFLNVNTGNIKIKLEHNDGAYILSVEDNGIGLPEDFNIESIDSLGLMLVRSLADQINGTLDIISINGTKFVLKLPEQSGH
jgi:two-component sensor histidine kinase